MRVLLLGGTAEARALAARLHPRVDIISSLAGRVPDPALPVGPVRIGGFGGAVELRKWLVENRINAVVDATPPFAAGLTANAAAACGEIAVPYLVLHRPPWDAIGAFEVDSDTAAAEHVAAKGYSRVFLTTGRSGVAPFRHSSAWFLVRVVTAPDSASLPRNCELVLSRGPYRYEDERALMANKGIQAVVTKNSGGVMTQPKLQAAHDLGIDVVMIRRPALPTGVRTVGTVDDAEAWVLSRDSGAG
jgi:precorrin-6A/cobalt-precorrin-6A reductase